MEIGSPVWLRQKDGWNAGQIIEKTCGEKKTMLVLFMEGNTSNRVELSIENGVEETENLKLRNAYGSTLEDQIDDLIELTHLNEPSILHILLDRFRHNLIYTNNGPILLAVNPFKQIPLYTDQHLKQYYNHGLLKAQGVENLKPLPPHVYTVADAAYRQMTASFLSHKSSKTENESQSILVSGESGAGKTETTKILMKYLATVGSSTGTVDGNDSSITGKVLDSNPILEAFGNACTVRNNNSSRFGKFIQMQFSQHGKLVGASIQTYLLEKVRIVNQANNERNYHIFYQLCSGAPEELKKLWNLKQAEDYHYLDQGDLFILDDTDDAKDFERTESAMKTVGFSLEEINDCFKTLAGLLHLGNINFQARNSGENRDQEAELDTNYLDEANYCAELFGVSLEELERTLCTRKIAARHETIEKRLTISQSEDSRDALAKSIYAKLFLWIVWRVNSCIKMTEDFRSFISVLDIFGFEIFERNNFEQLCINYTNEKLQQQFNRHIFTIEQALYKEEKISWSFVNYPDNQECLDLMEERPNGIISLIDDEIRIPGGNDRSLAQKFYRLFENHPRLHASSRDRVEFRFVIRHYAGDVTYETGGFCEKNRDSLPNSIVKLIENSSVFLQYIVNGEYLIQKSNRAVRPKSRKSVAAPPKQTQTTEGHDNITSVSSQFKQQLQNLMDCIHSTCPHFIRCLKPNDSNVSDQFTKERVVQQLQYGGVLEAVKVAQSGYPIRMQHNDFFIRYKMLSKHQHKTYQSLIKELQKNDDEIQIGITRVFLRKSTYNRLEGKRALQMFQASTKISMTYRGRLVWRRYQYLRRCVLRIQCTIRMFLAQRRVQKIRRTNASTLIQALIKGFITKRKYRRFHQSVVRLESLYRGRCAREFCRKKRYLNATISIQSYIKMYLDRKAYQCNRKNIIRLQLRWRCRIASRILRQLRQEAKDVGKLQEINESMKQELTDLKERMELEVKIKEEEGKRKAEALAAAAEEKLLKLEAEALEKSRKIEAEILRKATEAEKLAEKKAIEDAALLRETIDRMENGLKAEREARLIAEEALRQKEALVEQQLLFEQQLLMNKRLSEVPEEETNEEEEESREEVQMTINQQDEITNLKQLLEVEKEKNFRLENQLADKRHEKLDSDSDDNQNRKSNVKESNDCNGIREDCYDSGSEIHFPRARHPTSETTQSLAAFEANLHTIKVKLLVGIAMTQLEGKEKKPLILKLSLEKKGATVILSNFSFIIVETMLLEDIIEVRSGDSEDDPRDDSSSSCYYLSLITPRKTITLVTSILEDRNAIATGLRNVIADMSLRQDSTAGVVRTNSSSCLNNEKHKSMSMLRRASAQRLLSKKSKINRIIPEMAIDEPRMHLLKTQLKEYEKSYEKMLIKLMETVNELQEKNAIILELKKNCDLEPHNRTPYKESSHNIQVEKKFASSLLEKEDFHNSKLHNEGALESKKSFVSLEALQPIKECYTNQMTRV